MRGFISFLTMLVQKVNVMAWMVFELADYNVEVWYVSHYISIPTFDTVSHLVSFYNFPLFKTYQWD